jgi:glyoxylase-like metal-dependent hydrolase (beta-lactamase superfamily II)
MAPISDAQRWSGWVGGACWWLETLHKRWCKNVFASDHLFADDTPVPVLDPGRGRTKMGRLWVYAREQRPWASRSFTHFAPCHPFRRVYYQQH